MPPPRPARAQQRQQPRQQQQSKLPHLCLQARAAIAGAAFVVASIAAAALALRALVSAFGGARVAAAYALLEAVFAVFYARQSRRLCAQLDGDRPHGHDPDAFIESWLAHLAELDAGGGEMLSPWFCDAPLESIKRDNVAELFAYAFYYAPLRELRAGDATAAAMLERVVDAVDAKFGFSLEPGYNLDLRFMSHLWDPVRHTYRPAFFYAAMELLALLAHVMLVAAGFARHTLNGTAYYTLGLAAPLSPVQQQQQQQLLQEQHRPHRRPARHAANDDGDDTDAVADASATVVDTAAANTANTTTGGRSGAPILFLHGVGAALLPYVDLALRLASRTRRPLLLPEARHVSMRVCLRVPTVVEGADEAADMLARHGARRCVLASHSYGSTVAARLLQARPELIEAAAFIDPVCFGMFLPHLLRNFLYVRHYSGVWLLDAIIALISSELHCAAALSRGFHWTDYNLFGTHLPRHTLVTLGGRDILSPVAAVRDWLRAHTRARVAFDAAQPHAGFLLSPPWRERILGEFVDLLARADADGDGGGGVRNGNGAAAVAPAGGSDKTA